MSGFEVMIETTVVNRTTVEVQRKRKWLTLLVISTCSLALVALVALAGLFVYLPYDELVSGPKAGKVLKVLEGEFSRIAPLPDALQVRHGSMHKTHQGHVGSDYKTSLTYDEIRAHYDSELRKHGFTFLMEKPVTSWWQDYGGKQLFYCKGHYAATVQYSGREESNVGWTYNFSLSWGLFDECK